MAIDGNTSTGPVLLDALTGADKPDPPSRAPEFVNEHVGIGTLDDRLLALMDGERGARPPA